MTLTVVDIATGLSAGLLAASRYLNAAKPLWAKLPKVVSAALPVLVLALPQLASAAGLVTTGESLAMFGVSAVALLVPALTAAEAAPAAPPAA